jgi:hypothetical protein
MKKLFLFLTLTCILQVNAQKVNELQVRTLAEYYSKAQWHDSENPPTPLPTEIPDNLKSTYKFIQEISKEENNVFSLEFLKRPNDETLLHIFWIDKVESAISNSQNVDEVIKKIETFKVNPLDMIHSYYRLLFNSKIQSEKNDFSKINLQTSTWGFKDLSEQRITEYTLIDLYSFKIEFYITFFREPNCDGANEDFSKMPKINGLSYYSVKDANFSDFSSYPSFSDLPLKETLVQSYKKLLKANLTCADAKNTKLVSELKTHPMLK